MKAILLDIWDETIGWLAILSFVIALTMIAGMWVRVIDAINQAGPLVFAFCLIIAALSLTVLPRAPAVTALACVSLLGAGFRVVPELAGRAMQTLPSAHHLRTDHSVTLVTFNVHGYRNQNIRQAVSWLKQVNPDYIMLQEAEGYGAQIITGVSDTWPYVTACSRTGRCLGWILSRQPPLITNPDHAGADSPWARAVFQHHNGAEQFALMSAHTAWPLNKPLNPLQLSATVQTRQYRAIAEQVQALGSDSVILTGDFNSGGWSHALNRLSPEAGLVRHSLALPSWPAYPIWRGQPKGPVLPIDHVMAGKNWRLVSIERGPALGSDHYPLLATLDWAGPSEFARSNSIQPNVEAGR